MARLDDRGGRDAAGHGPYHRPDAELTPLRELGDWSLGKGEPDIRGWEVRTVGGRAIGTVRDLLVDKPAGEVAALDLDMDDGHSRGRAPIRAVQIDRAARIVRMDSADLLTGTGQPMDFRADVEHPGENRAVRDERPFTDRSVERTPDADADRKQVAGDSMEETVVERRPVVVEEVVVRRRVVESDDAATGETDHTRPGDERLDR